MTFMNEYLKNLMALVPYVSSSNFADASFLDIQIFKSFRRSSDTTDTVSNDEMYSLRQLIRRSPDFLQNHIFKIKVRAQEAQEECYKYIQIKVKEIQTCIQGDHGAPELSRLVQLVDISDKILYTDIHQGRA